MSKKEGINGEKITAYSSEKEFLNDLKNALKIGHGIKVQKIELEECGEGITNLCKNIFLK